MVSKQSRRHVGRTTYVMNELPASIYLTYLYRYTERTPPVATTVREICSPEKRSVPWCVPMEVLGIRQALGTNTPTTYADCEAQQQTRSTRNRKDARGTRLAIFGGKGHSKEKAAMM